jgi:hypothetical protein
LNLDSLYITDITKLGGRLYSKERAIADSSISSFKEELRLGIRLSIRAEAIFTGFLLEDSSSSIQEIVLYFNALRFI